MQETYLAIQGLVWHSIMIGSILGIVMGLLLSFWPKGRI